MEANRSYLRRYQRVIELMDAGFCALRLSRDADGSVCEVVFLEANPAFERLTGIPRIVGEGTNAIPGNHWPDWLARLQLIADDGVAERRQVWVEALGDRCFDVYAFRLGEPRDDYIALLFAEVTQKQKADAALREAESRLRTVMSNVGDAVFLLDLETDLHSMISPSAEGLTGYSVEELESLSGAEALEHAHPHDRHIPRQQQAILAAGGKGPSTVEYRWRVKSGEYRWLRDHRSLVRDDSGKPVALVAVVSDITATRAMEEELRISQAALDEALRAEQKARREADEELERTKLLLHAAAALSEPTNPAGVCAALADVLASATGLRITISEWNEEGRWLQLAVATGDIPCPILGRLGWKQLDPTTQRCISERVSVVNTLETWAQPLRLEAEPYGGLLALQVPIVYRGHLLGIVGLDEPFARHDFTEREIRLSEAIASQAAAALENARLYETEHQIAETLQETLIVLPTCVPGVTFSRSYESATAQVGRVGGDFVDVFEAHGQVVGIAVGDVAGKGIGAAVTTSLVRTTLRVHALDGLTPRAIATKANQIMGKFTDNESFVTLWFGLLNTKTGLLRYVCAGHPPALVLRADGEFRELDTSSPLIGAYEEAVYDEAQTVLEPGDRLVLYSDGATEARSPDGSFLGTQRLLGLIERHHAEPTVALSEAVMHEVMEFSGGVFRDDVAILAVEPVTLRTPAHDERQLQAFTCD